MVIIDSDGVGSFVVCFLYTSDVNLISGDVVNGAINGIVCS